MKYSTKKILLFSMATVVSCTITTMAYANKASANDSHISIDTELFLDLDSEEEFIESSESFDIDSVELTEDTQNLVVTQDMIQDSIHPNTNTLPLDSSNYITSIVPTTFTEKLLTITNTSYIADSFQGVSALYRPGKSDGSDATYSCAAFIKKYYKTVYATSVNNLFYKRTPNAVGTDSFITVTVPQVGDIVADHYSTRGTTHWAIVKAVNPNGTVTLIEQNWKWQQGGKTVTRVNRSVSNNSVIFFRLKSLVK